MADPGAELVLAAHKLGAQVKPLVGPSSILLGLMASGLNGQRFAFQGYLPHDTHERTAKLKQLEIESRKLQQTQIWIETPYRNTAMLMACINSLAPQSLLCLGVDLSLPSEMITTLSIADWRKRYPNEAASASLQPGDTIEVKTVFQQTPPAIVRYFDPYAGTGTGIQSLLETFNFGSYSPGINFMLMPLNG